MNWYEPTCRRAEPSEEHTMERQKGFTLIELLVVIAVIALLMAIP